jgi:integrase
MAATKYPGIEVRVNKDGSKTYRLRWKQGGGRSGPQLSHSFDRLTDAVEARARILAAGYVCRCPEHDPGGSSKPAAGLVGSSPGRSRLAAVSGVPLFGDYAADHIEALTGVGPGYRARFVRELARHFAPFLDRPLDEITERDVRLWIRGMEEGTHPWTVERVPGTDHDYRPRPMSPTTVRRLLVQAGSVMAVAQKEGLVIGNPFRGHRVGRRDTDKHAAMTVLTHEEWAALEAALPAGVHRDLGRLLVGTGLRWGEATALAVGAVDPLVSPPVIRVARAWKSDGRNGYVLGPPKSARSRRTVPVAGAVLDALLPHLSGKRDDELVFTTPRGAPVRHSNWYHRVWRPALERAGLDKRPRIHDLRHTHVSWLIGAGVDIAAVSKRLGHESISTTIDRYHHILPQVEADTLAALEVAMPTLRDRR